MLDFKYHISSLIAVFLALTVGILLGSVIVDKGIIAKQQQTLIDSVQADIRTVSSENEDLKADLRDSILLEKALLPSVIGGRLAGRSIIFISSKKYPDGGLIDSLKETIETAGAKANFLTISPDVGLSIKDNLESLAVILGIDPNDESLKLKVIARLADELTRGGDRPLLKKLLAQKIVRSDLRTPLYGSDFVFISDDQDGFDPAAFDLPMIEALKLKTDSIVAIEVETTVKSSVPCYQDLAISTVDNIDEPSGLISLIYSLSGSPANYGSKETADRLLPIEVTDR